MEMEIEYSLATKSMLFLFFCHVDFVFTPEIYIQ